jgi:hypothetical protein
MAKVIEFPSGANSEFARDSISFFAIVDGKRVLCLVSAEVLQTVFASGRSERELLNCFGRNRAAIEAAAIQMIGSGKIDDKGEVLLTTKTFRH